MNSSNNSADLLKELWPKFRSYIPEAGQRSVEEYGTSTIDSDGDLVTPLVEGKRESNSSRMEYHAE